MGCMMMDSPILMCIVFCLLVSVKAFQLPVTSTLRDDRCVHSPSHETAGFRAWEGRCLLTTLEADDGSPKPVLGFPGGGIFFWVRRGDPYCFRARAFAS